ncbi:hypothetical protein ACTD5D_09395 [Nocardia takedensis]|uniref:hypothetical protein n=1 Tax=Nocardia takedensis TaxID=259390 RepID=UPI003F76130E
MPDAVTSTSTKSRNHCRFPGCDAALPTRTPGRRGAPRRYCDNPDHTAQTALRALRDAATAESIPHPPPRPLTDETPTLAALLDRYNGLRDELLTVTRETDALFAHLADPAVVDREIAETHRQAGDRIAEAEHACVQAERARATMAERLARAVESEGRALATAREARTASRDAALRADAVERDAAHRIAAAERGRDRAEQNAAAVMTEARAEVEAALLAQARAEGERDVVAAENRALIAEIADLREVLDTERAEHWSRIEHRDIEYGRAITAAHVLASRTAREHRNQIDDLIERCTPDSGIGVRAAPCPPGTEGNGEMSS